MSIAEKVSAVETVFQLLDEEIFLFKRESSLTCISGCGECCKKPDIEATVLEFLPYAYDLYRQKAALDKLEQLKTHAGSICTIFHSLPGKGGSCTAYRYRGLICRLFGFSATTNKAGQAVLATCKNIKSEMSADYEKTVTAIENGAYIPVMSEYYMRLYAIDMELSRKFYPINEALKRAIETVLAYYAYREDENS